MSDFQKSFATLRKLHKLHTELHAVLVKSGMVSSATTAGQILAIAEDAIFDAHGVTDTATWTREKWLEARAQAAKERGPGPILGPSPVEYTTLPAGYIIIDQATLEKAFGGAHCFDQHTQNVINVRIRELFKSQ